MQNFIKIFQKVQEVGPFSLFLFFQNLDLGKASTNDKWHLTSPWARSCQYQLYAKFHHNIPLSSRNRVAFTFSEFGPRRSLNDKCHFAIASARSHQYQCINKTLSKYSLWFKSYGQFSLFHNLDLGKASTNGKWYLAIPWARS